jgi:tetratricopeptide (TPR) repeat protein
VYPTELMATHGFTSVEPWPIDRQGRDISVIRNQTDGPVSLFTYSTREPFVGVYHPRTKSGTIHLADPAELPVHKVWSWGNDRDAATWREALSDDQSGYVELQAGLFRNQETYAFLEPQESVRFTEYWLPVRDLGGITRATVDGVLHIERPTPDRLRVSLDVTRDLPDAHLVLKTGETQESTVQTLTPRVVWRREIAGGSVDLELTDQSGNVLLRHRDNRFDLTPAASVKLGPQPNTRPVRTATSSPDEIVESGTLDELEGRRLTAIAAYQEGLARYPNSFPLLKAAGRLAIGLGWAEANTNEGPAKASTSQPPPPPSVDVLGWLESAHSRNTTDFEVQYYLGLGLAAAGRTTEARRHLASAQRFRATRVAATLQLARLSAKDGNVVQALTLVQTVLSDSPRVVTLGALEVSLLRRLRRLSEAHERLRYWRMVDPTSSVLRYESVLLGTPDASLWPHLGSDVNRVLDLVDHYLTFGAYDTALKILELDYPDVKAPLRENGAVVPRESPLLAYYRGYVIDHVGGNGREDFETAQRLSTTYVFPNRSSSYAVLRAALRANPRDGTACYLLGSLYLASGLTEPAVAMWRAARGLQPTLPTLHRNLGLVLLLGTPNYEEARAVLAEGLERDPHNVEVYFALDGVLSAVAAPAAERVAALRQFAETDRMPSLMVFKLALALAEAGDAAGAERLFHNRFFPREEGGTNVRAVYAQTRVISARVAADAKDCATALSIVDALPAERQDLPFTRGTLADALQPPAIMQQLAAIESACGRREAARERWERLERPLSGNGGPVDIAVADQARRQLQHQRTDDQRRRLEDALASAKTILDSGGTSSPGTLEYARALMLDALDRKDEAQRSLERVFLYPDRNLSHVLAREARRTLRN